jgi:LemA protein
LQFLATLVLGVLLSACGINESARLDNAADAKWSDVQAALQRRSDLVPQLVATVQASAKFEQSTLTAVTEARASATKVTLNVNDLTDPAKVQAFMAAQNSLGGALSRLMVASENYPELKSTAAFADLMNQLEGTQNRVTTEIVKYNEKVQAYNDCVTTVPCGAGAYARGYTERPTFQASEAAQANPTVDFGGLNGGGK